MSGPWIELTMPFTWALVHFYQVAAAQDKLVKYNMSHIKQGTCPLLMELSYLINHVLFSLISLTGVV